MKNTDIEGQHLIAERAATRAERPIKATYNIATLGSKTRMGGEIVSASTGMVIEKHRVACVGDRVRYPDGSESTIVSGAGTALTVKGTPAAIVGSALANGDTVTCSLQSLYRISEYSDDNGIPGLLQPDWRTENRM